MHSIRRPAAALGALATVSLLAVAAPAHAVAPAHASASAVGTASASTAHLGLDVKLLNSTVDVPVDVDLNAVQAPGTSNNTVLTATVQGAGSSGPMTLVEAKVAHTVVSADAKGSHALVDLVGARIDVPGLMGGGLLGLSEVHAQADCPVHGRPSAQVDELGDITVLGKTLSLSVGGPSHVTVPGIGSVTLWESKKTVTSTTAAATAIDLEISVNPLKLNIAEVTGSVQLAAVRCSEPVPPVHPVTTVSAAPSSSTPSKAAVPATPAADPTDPTNGTTTLATTGGGGDTPLLIGGALVLLGAGAGSVVLARRRRS